MKYMIEYDFETVSECFGAIEMNLGRLVAAIEVRYERCRWVMMLYVTVYIQDGILIENRMCFRWLGLSYIK